MVEPHDVESSRACASTRVDMVLGLDQKSIGILGKVSGANRVDNVGGSPDEDAAALGGTGITRMRDHRLEHPAMQRVSTNR